MHAQPFPGRQGQGVSCRVLACFGLVLILAGGILDLPLPFHTMPMSCLQPAVLCHAMACNAQHLLNLPPALANYMPQRFLPLLQSTHPSFRRTIPPAATSCSFRRQRRRGGTGEQGALLCLKPMNLQSSSAHRGSRLQASPVNAVFYHLYRSKQQTRAKQAAV